MASGGLYLQLTSTVYSPHNHLCTLDTTLRILDTQWDYMFGIIYHYLKTDDGIYKKLMFFKSDPKRACSNPRLFDVNFTLTISPQHRNKQH